MVLGSGFVFNKHTPVKFDIDMCCIISGEPVEDKKGRVKTYRVGDDGRVLFQTGMVCILLFIIYFRPLIPTVYRWMLLVLIALILVFGSVVNSYPLAWVALSIT